MGDFVIEADENRWIVKTPWGERLSMYSAHPMSRHEAHALRDLLRKIYQRGQTDLVNEIRQKLRLDEVNHSV